MPLDFAPRPFLDLWTRDDQPLPSALSSTRFLGIGAHQDDLELLAFPGILHGLSDTSFSGVVCTDGRGSPRTGIHAHLTPDQLALARIKEQRDAARIGNYRAVIQLGYPSSDLRSDTSASSLVSDLETILLAAAPEVVYTHHPADRHPTHLAVFHATLKALRRLPPGQRPRQVLGGEVWGSLDWLEPGDRVELDVSGHHDFAERLLRVFRTQIEGGKRYDLAALGRRQANATFSASHTIDACPEISFALDLTPLLDSPELDIAAFLAPLLDRFKNRILHPWPSPSAP
ncbi:MAG TPA: PIG-L family deacetylase [Kiritimatiellia bacterium]|nr:PIG-L family deacetylase [Kiritimatiellia bacterium]